jgi:hypothetical protein
MGHIVSGPNRGSQTDLDDDEDQDVILIHDVLPSLTSIPTCSVRHRSAAANDANQRALKSQVTPHNRRYDDQRRKFEMYSDATVLHLWRTGLSSVCPRS